MSDDNPHPDAMTTEQAAEAEENREAGNIFDKHFDSDLTMVVSTVVALYAVFIFFGILLGNDINGQFNALQQLTFLITVYVMLSLALNLHWGYTGLFNIGIAGFMAVGAYTFAIATASPTPANASDIPGLGLPFFVGIILALAVSGLVGFIAALPALRLRADYLAIVTIALSEIIRFGLKSKALSQFSILGIEMGTGGAGGISVDKPPSRVLITDGIGAIPGLSALVDAFISIGTSIGVNRSVMVSMLYTGVLILVAAGFYWLLVRIGFSPFGRVLKAIREDEDVANALGKDTANFKIKAFVVGCALMGLVGVLWWANAGFINTEPFKPKTTFFIWIALIIGGSGSTTGSVMGGVLFIGTLYQGPITFVGIVKEAFGIQGSGPGTIVDAFALVLQGQVMPLFEYIMANIEPLRLVLMGAVLIWFMQNKPDGLLGDRKELATSLDPRKVTRPPSKAAATDGGVDGGEDNE
ncbi:branched-chain amino acid ABC transporter permease [Haloarchaeobius sp. HME9146]|uniref:branched-chain amino acid ABC transporter permease n=1 Tax=Haloarchaeobius sp. HME9146 TaxID=2978732 RepID=UPI0021BE7C57|nr:branched-chain amino acid ABC transporter permease [Haloarchaeobius sp. HME9146]MCT9096624.1 branched-chain amino acid ABC transporter permease [Haloarchaeobius sp. HME9146]